MRKEISVAMQCCFQLQGYVSTKTWNDLKPPKGDKKYNWHALAFHFVRWLIDGWESTISGGGGVK